MSFLAPDFKHYPCLELAYEALNAGQGTQTVMNAANEIAVEYFLEGKIKYIDIAIIIERCLNQIRFNSTLSYDSLVELDQQTRAYARTICQYGTT